MQCASCGHSNREQAKFCEQCGLPLSGRAVLPDPRTAMPAHLAQRILNARSALLGERKQVTVLFADIESSMPLAERLGAEQWHKLLERFFHILNEGVHRFEGTVNQYTGDGMMALFGAPLAHEDHAERACRAALELCTRLRAFGDELRAARGLELRVRMGLNSGEVVVGTIGDDLRMEYTAQGHTVGLAQRVEQLAEPNTVCMARATALLVPDLFELCDRGEFTLKGVSDPVRVYRLDAAKPDRARIDAVLTRSGARLVGRRSELDLLERALAEACAGRGQVVGVVGEPGVGKTRLCLELVRLARRDAAVAQAHCPAHAVSVAWLPLRELLRSLFDLGAADSADVSRRKTRRALLKLSPTFEDVLPRAYELLEIAEEPPAALLEDERRTHAAALLRRIVQSQSAVKPLLLLIDDVHCIDRDGDVLLGEIVDALGWTRTLLLVNFRPGFQASWMRVPYYREVPLAALGSSDTEELLGELVGDDPSTVELRAQIGEHTGGNPFFAEQVIQALLERGVLVDDAPPAARRGARRARLRLVAPIADIAIPPTVQALLTARLDRLPEREKVVLQAAAVIGRTFTPEVLQHVVAQELGTTLSAGEGGAADLADVLRALETADFVRSGGDAAAVEYAFRHPLTQAATYASQLAETRARLHIAVTRALQDIHAERLGQYAGLLAHHFAAANWRFEAMRWRRRAALHVTSIELRKPRSR